MPAYDDLYAYLTSSFGRVDKSLVKSMCDFAYSFYSNEIGSLNLPDFPVENLDKLVRIMNKCHLPSTQQQHKNLEGVAAYDARFFRLSQLIDKIYPYKLILKDEAANKKLYFELMQKFNITPPAIQSTTSNQIDYKLLDVESRSIAENEQQSTNQKRLKFISYSYSNDEPLMIELIGGEQRDGVNNFVNKLDAFVMNDYHSSKLVDMMLTHAGECDFCLIGAAGSGKTELIKQFANMLDYNIQTIYLYKDMSARDLIQQRVTLANGDTKWHNSPLVEAALAGDIAVLDGVHRLRDDTLMSLRRLVQDRELELLDGTKLLHHKKYDELVSEMRKNVLPMTNENELIKQKKLLRIHPSFRIIATAEPPAAKSSLKETSDEKRSKSSSPAASSNSLGKASAATSNEWLNSEVLNLFLYHNVEQLDARYELEILNKKFKLNKQHEHLLEMVEKMKSGGGDEQSQLRHVGKLFSLRKLIHLSNKLEKYPDSNLIELFENACLLKFMPQLNRQLVGEFITANRPRYAVKEENESEWSLSEFDKHKLPAQEQNEKDATVALGELAKIPDTLFYENRLHKKILNNLLKDFELGEHLLLIGNQGTGKNKLVDKFLMLTNRPREYMQLHRDTTVHSLTVQPVIRAGVVHYDDSPLVKAVKHGYVLVVDEADKAPLHVTCILKSLIESDEMILSDGRRIVAGDYRTPSSHARQSSQLIRMHPNFRMIILANRPGFPFLGNDFFAVLGDLISCHPVDNPDAYSEIEMLRMYAPHVDEKVLNKLVNAFAALRELSDQGLVSYPYSTRELVNICKHLEKFPDDSLSSVLKNVSSFDYYVEQGDLKSAFNEVMNKYGIPVGTSLFHINLAKSYKLPGILPLEKFRLKAATENSSNAAQVESIVDLKWSPLAYVKEVKVAKYKCELNEARVDSFSELRSTRLLNNTQQLISDLVVTRDGQNDLIYVAGLKPLSVLQLNTNTNQIVEFDLSEFFNSAWVSYFPRLKLLKMNQQPNRVVVFEESANELFMVDFENERVFAVEKKTKETTSNTMHIVKKARHKLNKYFIDQNQSYKMIRLSDGEEELAGFEFVWYRTNTDHLSFIDMRGSREVNVCLSQLSLTGKHYKPGISHVQVLDNNKLLLACYNTNEIENSLNVSVNDLKYFVLEYPSSSVTSRPLSANESIDDLNQLFKLYSMNENLFGSSKNDLLLQQIELKNIKYDDSNKKKDDNTKGKLLEVNFS
jgi:von Willebrand factor A domain-containing protein 8